MLDRPGMVAYNPYAAKLRWTLTTGVAMYIVTGFYTPNYSAIADSFRHNLNEHSIPHKLYPVEMLGGTWQVQTLRKPEIALRALDEHPDRIVILMDVDCSVHGDLSPLLEPQCDVAVYPLRNKRRGSLSASTRVVVLHQTLGARHLLTAWHQKCNNVIRPVLSQNISSWKRHIAEASDETLLRRAIEENPEVVVASLPASYAGHSSRRSALVKHESAHDRFTWPDRMKSRIKRIRRGFVEQITGRPYKEWKYGID